MKKTSNIGTKSAVLLVAATMLFTTGFKCSKLSSVGAAPVVVALTGVVDASIAAVGIVSGLEVLGQVSPAEAQAVIALANWSRDRANQTLAEWRTTDSLQTKISDAISYWSQPPGVPPNLSAGVAGIIQTVLASIEQFKQQLNTAGSAASAHSMTANQEKKMVASNGPGFAELQAHLAVLDKKIAAAQAAR